MVFAFKFGVGCCAHCLRHCATTSPVAGSLTFSFRSHYGRGFDSTSNRHKYQVDLFVVKSGRCIRLTTFSHSCDNFLDI